MINNKVQLSIPVDKGIYRKIESYFIEKFSSSEDGLLIVTSDNINTCLVKKNADFIYCCFYHFSTCLNNRKSTDFKNLHSKYKRFVKQVGKKRWSTKEVEDLLVKLKLIIKNDVYKVAEFSKSYKLNSTIKFDKLLNYELQYTASSSFFRKTSKKSNLQAFDEKYHKLIENDYSCTIDIDSLSKDSSIDPKVLPMYLEEARMYNSKEYRWFAICDTGRFYSSSSNLRSILRKYFLIEGERTLSVDSVNSQPLLLASMLNNDSFKKDTSKGGFYEKIMAATLISNRDKAKEWCYRHIFFSNFGISTSTAKILNEAYPGLANDIQDFLYRSKEPMYMLLQKKEVNIWVEAAIKMEEKVIVVHDQMYFKRSDITSVMNNINSSFVRNNVLSYTLELNEMKLYHEKGKCIREIK